MKTKDPYNKTRCTILSNTASMIQQWYTRHLVDVSQEVAIGKPQLKWKRNA